MAELDPSSDSLADKVSDAYQVELASLSREGLAQVHDGLADTAGADADALVHQAADADVHRHNVEDLHKEQADAVAAGDYAHANDLAHQSEYEIRAVESDGGEGDLQLAQALKDEDHTADAVWHKETAADAANTAAWDASSGHEIAASEAATTAANESSTADNLAGHADQGGATADHSYSSDSSVSETSE